jgi:hypothetical protein
MELPLVPNFHVLKVTYLGATNFKPSKYKISSERFRCSATFAYSNSPDYDNCNDAISYAIVKLTKLGFNIIGKGEAKDHMYIITYTFESVTKYQIK